jgi:hypothetical protein
MSTLYFNQSNACRLPNICFLAHWTDWVYTVTDPHPHTNENPSKNVQHETDVTLLFQQQHSTHRMNVVHETVSDEL